MKTPRYMFPAIISGLLLATVFVAGDFCPRHYGRERTVANQEAEWAKVAMPEVPPDLVEIQHARILCVVVEKDGYYIGKEFIPFILLQKTLGDRAEEWKADCAVVAGTASSRYVRVVEAIDTIRKVLGVPVEMETVTMIDGTRRTPLTIGDYPCAFPENDPT